MMNLLVRYICFLIICYISEPLNTAFKTFFNLYPLQNWFCLFVLQTMASEILLEYGILFYKCYYVLFISGFTMLVLNS